MIDNVLNRLSGVKQTGPEKWLARCPAHDDRSPSLAVRLADDKVLLHCFGGCEVADVLAAIGLELSDLFPERVPRPGAPRPQAARFNAYELFPLLVQEAMILALAWCDTISEREVSEADFRRTLQAYAAVYRLSCEVQR